MSNWTKLNDSYEYDPLTGELKWKRKSRGSGIGQSAGYRNVKLNRWYVSDLEGKQIQRARAIWHLVTGSDPGKNRVVHISTDTSDDRWDNLKLVMSRKHKPIMTDHGSTIDREAERDDEAMAAGNINMTADGEGEGTPLFSSSLVTDC